MTEAADTSSQPEPEKGQAGPKVSRRGLLFGAGVLGGGLIGGAAGYGVGSATAPAGAPAPESQVKKVTPGIANTTVNVSAPIGTDTIDFYGKRQAGVTTPVQAHGIFMGLNLLDRTDGDALQRMMRILSSDAARLTQGRGTLADLDEELAAAPARLTITFGFGEEIFARTKPELKPDWLKPLPKYGIDQLDPAYTGGDLLIKVAGDNPASVAHARRMMLKNVRAFASVAWIQTGFTQARGAHPEKTTMRNLFGQIDGTSNPHGEAQDRVVWGEGKGDGKGKQDLKPWLPGGTSMVIRRIAMNLDTWDELDRNAQEEVIGRRLGSGAPLTGKDEHDAPDFDATTEAGFPVISDIAHIRRSRTEDTDQAMFRRAFNYDDPPVTNTDLQEPHGQTGVSHSGLIFVAFQADVDKQFVPIQDRLAESDHLNLWTIPVGSAVFAIPPGCDQNGYIGEDLFA